MGLAIIPNGAGAAADLATRPVAALGEQIGAAFSRDAERSSKGTSAFHGLLSWAAAGPIVGPAVIGLVALTTTPNRSALWRLYGTAAASVLSTVGIMVATNSVHHLKAMVIAGALSAVPNFCFEAASIIRPTKS